ncbi:MAG: metal-dependent hydrolase [Sandaracinaceae bacterium]
MDSITQGLLGAAIAEAGFRGKLGGRALAWGAFCGVAPDFDMVAALAGEWEALVHHRGASHSWIVQSLLAPVLGYLAWRFWSRREGAWWQWAHLSWWALVTHPALDVCTAYGTQLFAPLSAHRYAIDAVAIIDLVYTVPLLVAVIWAWRGELRSRSRRVAIGALAFTTAYLAFGFVQSQRAIAQAEASLAAEGFESREIRALPTLGNVFVHRIVARDGEGRFRVALGSLSAPRPLRWDALRDEEDPLVDAAMRTDELRIFRWFAMGYAHAELEHVDAGFDVVVEDLRYGSIVEPTRALWGATAHYDREGDLRGVERWQRQREMDVGAELSALGRLLTHP